MRLNQLGEPDYGSPTIREITLEVMESQLSKRAQDTILYNKEILIELKREQPILYRILWDLAETFSMEWCRESEIEGTESWDRCIEFWTERLMFLVAFNYKIISVGAISQYMEGDIKL